MEGLEAVRKWLARSLLVACCATQQEMRARVELPLGKPGQELVAVASGDAGDSRDSNRLSLDGDVVGIHSTRDQLFRLQSRFHATIIDYVMSSP